MKPSRSLPISAALPGLALFPIQTIKELRVVLAPALFGSIWILLAGLTPDSVIGLVFWMAFPLTCTCIGALAFGHDFTHRTLGTVMALPIARKDIWRKRMRMCFLMMLPVALLVFANSELPLQWGSFTGRVPFSNDWYSHAYAVLQLLAPPILSGLFLAPWLTIVSRSPLFGALFATILPFFSFIAIEALASLIPTSQPAELASKLTTVTTILLWIAGFFLGKRAFMRMEVIDRATAVTFGGAISFAKPEKGLRRQNPAWQLLKKEFFLQRISIATGVLCAGFIFVFKNDQATSWALAYPTLLIVLIGSLGSAEERQLNVSEWHALLPIPHWQQWAIKTAVILSLAIAFGILIPAKVLFWRVPNPDQAAVHLMERMPTVILFAIVLGAVSLYVSSLCHTSLKAMLICLPVSIALFAAITGLESFLIENYELPSDSSELAQELFILSAAVTGVAAPALWFAMLNHFSNERSGGRTIRQLGWCTICCALASIGLHTLAGIFAD